MSETQEKEAPVINVDTDQNGDDIDAIKNTKKIKYARPKSTDRKSLQIDSIYQDDSYKKSRYFPIWSKYKSKTLFGLSKSTEEMNFKDKKNNPSENSKSEKRVRNKSNTSEPKEIVAKKEMNTIPGQFIRKNQNTQNDGSKKMFLKNLRQRPKSDSIPFGSNKTSPRNSLGLQYNICNECPPPTNAETRNPQLFPIEQKKEISGNHCVHSDMNVVVNKRKVKVKDIQGTSRVRSNSGSVIESTNLLFDNMKLPDPMKLPEDKPTSTLAFSSTPLKSADDDQFFVPNKKKPDVWQFRRLTKSTISKSEQSLTIPTHPTKVIQDALSPAKCNLDLGNETVEAAYLHGVQRVAENQQYVMLSKSHYGERLASFLTDGVHYIRESESFLTFFHLSTCYDLMPNNSKLVVLDSQLQVGKAFRALILNGVRAALIWKSVEQKYVGILTITDFIKILTLSMDTTSGCSSVDVEYQTIDKWREMTNADNKPLVSVLPESSLFTALEELKVHRVHRLPVIDMRSGNVLHIITHKRLMRYLALKRKDIPKADFLNLTVEAANVGTFDEVHTVNLDTPLREVLLIFVEKVISAVPVIDPVSKKLLDIFAKFDCIHLASSGNYKDLDLTVADALKCRGLNPFKVQTCLPSDTLEFVLEKIVRKEVHRLVVINNETDYQVVGIVSLADLLHYFVLRYAHRHSYRGSGCTNTLSNLSQSNCCSNPLLESSPSLNSSGKSSRRSSNGARGSGSGNLLFDTTQAKNVRRVSSPDTFNASNNANPDALN